MQVSFFCRFIRRCIMRGDARINPRSILINFMNPDTEERRREAPIGRNSNKAFHILARASHREWRNRGEFHDVSGLVGRGSVTVIVRGLPQRPANADLQWKAGYPAYAASKQMRRQKETRSLPNFPGIRIDMFANRLSIKLI